MGNLNIKYPKTAPKLTPNQFVASGEVDAEAVRVKGEIKPTGGGNAVQGTQLALIPKRRKKGDAKKLLWLIGFKKTGGFIAGEYDLTVTGYQADGTEVDSDTRKIKLETLRDVSIAFPSAGEMTVDEAVSITAYGTHTVHIRSATINNLPALNIYDDLDIGFWAASLPPLDKGTYTLVVVDENNGSASQGGIVVKEP